MATAATSDVRPFRTNRSDKSGGNRGGHDASRVAQRAHKYLLVEQDAAQHNLGRSNIDGRAFIQIIATSYLDTLATPGSTYSYLVHAYNAGEQSLGHSDRASATCCNPPV